MLYSKTLLPFDLRLFRTPTNDYRGVPFWSWNAKLDKDRLLRQLEHFKQMGMGGVHIHPRTGLATEYLGDEFMELIRACLEKAKELGLKIWLYDEDRWPSGFAGGLVTQDPQYRAKHLLWTCRPYNGQSGSTSLIAAAIATRTGQGELLARYQIDLAQGKLNQYRRLHGNETSHQGKIWYAYLETALPSPWFNNQTYVDTLSSDAIKRFIELTHERYATILGEYFGSDIPAIFTDEPQLVHKTMFVDENDQQDLMLPWTTDLELSYSEAYNSSLLDHLPELFWETPIGASQARYRYHDHVAERFTRAVSDQIGTWCQNHNLYLTGHMMSESTLESQTAAVGEVMRSYRSFQIPGIDILCDWREYNTVKQAQSAARQYGRESVSCELYGVTNWDFDFRGHKSQGDWLAALGVTTRVHHLAWYSMEGEAKRDYPAPIGYQSPWFQEYRLVEDHFARLNVELTRGKAVVRVGVIHPIESFWLCFGSHAVTQLEREEREERFEQITDWLLFGLHDFDFIAESLLPELCLTGSNPLEVGQGRYDVLLVPSLRTLRSSTVERLEQFQEAGGKLIFLGEIPSLLDATPSSRVQQVAAKSTCLEWSRRKLIEVLKPFQEISVEYVARTRLEKLFKPNAYSLRSLLCQIRQDGTDRFVFLCNTDHDAPRESIKIQLQGRWSVQHLDSMSGHQSCVSARVTTSSTTFEWDFAAHDHALFWLQPYIDQAIQSSTLTQWHSVGTLPEPFSVRLSEPNVLLLDTAEYALDDKPWQNNQEILRLDNTLRSQLGWHLRMEAIAQPWTNTNATSSLHTLRLRFTINSRVDVKAPLLAIENACQAEIFWNNKLVTKQITGWWVDEAIQTVQLPDFEAGQHQLEIRMPYTPLSNPEWCYLLGDFGVEVLGSHCTITEPIRNLAWGDWTNQGLPFYAGNITYCLELETEFRSEPLSLTIPHFKAALIKVKLEEQPVGVIAFAPYRLNLGKLETKTHLEITAFGNRVNAFGAVHLLDATWKWFGPNAWRSEGSAWSDEYQLKTMGVLTAPHLMKMIKKVADGGID